MYPSKFSAVFAGFTFTMHFFMHNRTGTLIKVKYIHTNSQMNALSKVEKDEGQQKGKPGSGKRKKVKII